ncbi:MAG: hypothetical protein HC905_27895, partial [Bacteroidales bacterium]|nr:hypothetical protein [Bacteroidales bacterium]
MGELKIRLNMLQPGEIVLLLVFNIDKNGAPISYDDILNELKPVCKSPIYGTWDFYLDKGIVGGKITRASTHGEYLAKIALLLLKGANISSIPVRAGPNEFVF